jgi:hypothetical protein
MTTGGVWRTDEDDEAAQEGRGDGLAVAPRLLQKGLGVVVIAVVVPLALVHVRGLARLSRVRFFASQEAEPWNGTIDLL